MAIWSLQKCEVFRIGLLASIVSALETVMSESRAMFQTPPISGLFHTSLNYDYQYISWPIFFYGTHQISWIPESNLRAFEENRETLGKNKHIKEAMRVSTAKSFQADKTIFRRVSPTLPSSFSSAMAVEKSCQKCGILVKPREDGFVTSQTKQRMSPSGMFTAERKSDDWKLQNLQINQADPAHYRNKNLRWRSRQRKKNHCLPHHLYLRRVHRRRNPLRAQVSLRTNKTP